MAKRSLDWTIAIRPDHGEPLRKITKIIGLNGDGFSVLVPYHKARAGFLLKHLMDLQGPQMRKIRLAECVAFTAEDRVKLSYHIDGFAQLSGENPGKIVSGRDQKTGEPKGLGLLTHSLHTPITSGPSVGITVWGIDEFETTTESDKLIVFEPSDFYYRNSTPEDANSWQVCVYAFAVGAVPPLRFEGKRPVMECALNTLSGGVPGAIVKMKSIHLESEKVYLGVYIDRFKVQFAAKSGWILNGPGNYTTSQGGYVLQAIYPRDIIRSGETGSLDRRPAP